MVTIVANQQVSGSSNVQLVGLLKYSGKSDNTATKRMYNKSNVHKNNTPQYMQIACNHIRVGAKYDRSPPALDPTASIQHRAALMADLMSPLSGLYRRVVILITICSGRPPTFTTK